MEENAGNNQANTIEEAFYCFCKASKTTKSQVAAAIGLSASDLSTSHLDDPGRSASIQQRMLYRLKRQNLPTIAARLNLDCEGYRALEQLFADVLTAILGWSITSGHYTMEEAIEMGVGGMDLFRQYKWKPASSLLLTSWAKLSEEFPQPDDSTFPVALCIGNELSSWLAYAGRHAQALEVAKTLVAKSRLQVVRSTNDVRTRVHLFNTAAIVFRHNNQHPETVLSYLTAAHDLSKNASLELNGRIATSRDQAKPLILQSLGQSNLDADKIKLALQMLDVSESLAKQILQRDQDPEPWLLTRLTRVECLSAIGLADMARQTYDETMDVELARTVAFADRSTPLRAKVAMAEVAAFADPNSLEQLAALCTRFAADADTIHFVERRMRANRMIDHATRGDIMSIRRLLVR